MYTLFLIRNGRLNNGLELRFPKKYHWRKHAMQMALDCEHEEAHVIVVSDFGKIVHRTEKLMNEHKLFRLTWKNHSEEVIEGTDIVHAFTRLYKKSKIKELSDLIQLR